MSVFLWILLTILVFSIVIALHEWGHFITARLTGMKVLEFGLGIPPRIKKLFTDKKGTDFTVNALPIGGFVRIAGEDIRSPEAFRDGAFLSKKLPQRILVLSAGVIMNFLLAWFIFFGLFLYGTKPLAPLPQASVPTYSFFLPTITEWLQSGYLVQDDSILLFPVEDSIAQKAGIQAGDKVMAVNEIPITSDKELIAAIQKNEEMTISVKRDDQEIAIAVVPQDGKLGVQISSPLSINQDFTKKATVTEAASLATSEVYHSTVLTFDLLKWLFGKLFFPKNEQEHKEAKESLSGPIGVGGTFVTMVQNGVPMMIVVIFTAFLSINLGVMNILPIPALDGGRIVTTTLYSICKRIGIDKQKYLIYESYINAGFFLLLLVFMLYIAWLDIMRFF